MLWNLIWLVALILFAVLEAVTAGLSSIWFCAGALVALIVSLLHGELWLQILLFLAVSAFSMAVLRPLAKKYFNPKNQATNADRVIGARAVVTEPINNLTATGRVSALGNEWTARSENNTNIPAGATVTVLRIEGVKVIVATEATSATGTSGKEQTYV